MSKEDKEELFEEARKNSIADMITKKESELPATIDKESTISVIKERLEEGETQWDLLARMIDGGLTKKFISIISNMPDRDFARNYLKLLEYFKPKITRSDGPEDPNADLTVNIQTLIVNDKGEKILVPIDEVIKKENKNEE